jgi:hypothetical protein
MATKQITVTINVDVPEDEEGEQKDQGPFVSFNYDGRFRIVEALFIKYVPNTQNFLLVGKEIACEHPKCYVLTKMSNIDMGSVMFPAEFPLE